MTPFNKLFLMAIKPWFIISYIAVIILSFMVLDRSLAYYFHAIDLRASYPALTLITNLALSPVYLIGFFMAGLFFRYLYKNKCWEHRAWFLWCCVAIPGLICLVLKVSLSRARPELLFSEQLYGFYGFKLKSIFWSFPSGHTSTIMGLVFGLSALFPRYFYVWITTGLFIASSRILLTNHYASDVLFASYLALLEVGVLFYYARHKKWLPSSHIRSANDACFHSPSLH